LVCGILLLALASCQDEPRVEPQARVSMQGGIINLVTLETMDAGTTLALHHGVFRRHGRCLVLEVDGAGATPVFPANSSVAISADGIRITGLDFKFGDTVALPGLGPRHLGEPIGECPAERRLVRAVEAAIRAR